MNQRSTEQTEQARRILTTGARDLLYWSENEAAIFQIDPLQNKWVAVGTPQEIIQLIASKGQR